MLFREVFEKFSSEPVFVRSMQFVQNFWSFNAQNPKCHVNHGGRPSVWIFKILDGGKNIVKSDCQVSITKHPDADAQLKQLFVILCDTEDVAGYTLVSVGEGPDWS
jgi:hypothetical protein